MSAPPRSTTTRCRPRSCAGWATRPRRTACGWPTRRSPGAGSSTTTGAPGGSSSSPTIRRVGVCLDSFHILSRGHDPAAIERDPRRQDLLPPARRRAGAHHGRAVVEPTPPALPRGGRLRPRRVRRARPRRRATPGPMSLEVFNDTFRQTDVVRTAQQAKRSLTWLEDRVAHAARRPPARRSRAASRGRPARRLRLRRGQGRGHRRRRRAPAAARASPSAAATAASRCGCGPRAGPGGLQRAAGARPGAHPGRGRVRGRRPGDVRGTRPGARRAGRVPAYPCAATQELPAFRAPDGTEVFLAVRRRGRCRVGGRVRGRARSPAALR